VVSVAQRLATSVVKIFQATIRLGLTKWVDLRVPSGPMPGVGRASDGKIRIDSSRRMESPGVMGRGLTSLTQLVPDLAFSGEADRRADAVPISRSLRRMAKIDESVRGTIIELMRTRPDSAQALWDAGPQAVRRHVPDITQAEWTAACNRNFWSVYQAELEKREGRSDSLQ
jgi:hypothetical protein